jgi:hypothetical protein
MTFAFVNWRTWVVPIGVDGGTHDVGYIALCVTGADQSSTIEIAVPVYHTILIRGNPLSASHWRRAAWISPVGELHADYHCLVDGFVSSDPSHKEEIFFGAIIFLYKTGLEVT